jgi:flagellar biosynthesis/type III secretory pathway protein FliH
MPAMLTIQLTHPIHVMDAPAASRMQGDRSSAAAHGRQDDGGNRQRETADGSGIQELARLCKTVKTITDKLNKVYEETIAGNRRDIARLAVEIARKILTTRVARGDYDMQAVIEEALKCVPARQHVAVRVNPEDLRSCQQLQQENPDGVFHGLELVADPALARADCLVETPKGIVKSFVEEHLEHVGEALLQVE